MKTLFITAGVLLTVAFTSCKKDYTCQCQMTRTSSNGSSFTSNDGTYTFKDSRTRAESKCNEQESAGTDAAGAYSRDCQIQ